MRKWLFSMVMALGLPALIGIGVGALTLVAAPTQAEAQYNCVNYRHCYWSYGNRYCVYKRRCAYVQPACSRVYRCYRQRYCYWSYGVRYCRYNRYCRYYTVCN